MIGMSRQRRPIIYGFDTETDNNGIDEAWIVQWALVRSDGKERHGRDLQELAHVIVEMLDRKNKTYLWYVHNLTYDINFLRQLIHDAGEIYDVSIIKRMSSFVMVRIHDKDSNSYIEFRDSAKKIPGSVKSLGKSIGLPKLEPPGGEHFEVGWSTRIDYDDPETWRYVIRDSEIVARAMQSLHDHGSTHATASGDTFASLRKYIARDKSFKSDWMWDKLFPHLPIDLDARLRKAYIGGLNISPIENRGWTVTEQSPLYPYVESKNDPHKKVKERDDVCEQVCSHTLRKTDVLRAFTSPCLTHGDVHNMYGAVMADDPLPYGLPTLTYTKPSDDSLYIAEVRIKFEMREGMVPYYAFKSAIDYCSEGLKAGEPVEWCGEWHELSMTNIDLELLQRFYHVEFDPDYPVCYWVFKQRMGTFREYIDSWTEIKERSEPGSVEYLNAKNHINMLYGRFALSYDGEVTSLEWDDDLEDWVYKSEIEINEDIVNYLPLAIFVTAHARRRLLTHVEDLGMRLIHSDTDSCIHKGPQSKAVTYGDHRGTWGIDDKKKRNPIEIFEGGFKRYIEIMNRPIRSLDDIKVTCAGVPQHRTDAGVPVDMWVELLDDPSLICTRTTLGEEHYRIKSAWIRNLYVENGMNPDDVDTRKNIPVKVRGGVILDKRTHELSDNLVYRIKRFR